MGSELSRKIEELRSDPIKRAELEERIQGYKVCYREKERRREEEKERRREEEKKRGREEDCTEKTEEGI